MRDINNNYSVILNKSTYERIKDYETALNIGVKCGAYLSKELSAQDSEALTKERLLVALLNTKRPQIFAESQVRGDGSDWTLNELSILGDISIGMTVDIYDNGAHQKPLIHDTPFAGHLIYTPGALLRNDLGYAPADWREVTHEGKIDRDKYYDLYERRLIPAFKYINAKAIERARPAFITIPGMGCGQFSGPFRGQMGYELETVLVRFLEKYAEQFSAIRAVYYDPYRESSNRELNINDIQFMVRPLTQGNHNKSQLSLPDILGSNGKGLFNDCELYSFVAWDHVSWPGNDYYRGSRMTDDGVKAAATNTMQIMTGIEGKYSQDQNMYLPPQRYSNWWAVVAENGLKFNLKHVFSV